MNYSPLLNERTRQRKNAFLYYSLCSRIENYIVHTVTTITLLHWRYLRFSWHTKMLSIFLIICEGSLSFLFISNLSERGNVSCELARILWEARTEWVFPNEIWCTSMNWKSQRRRVDLFICRKNIPILSVCSRIHKINLLCMSLNYRPRRQAMHHGQQLPLCSVLVQQNVENLYLWRKRERYKYNFFLSENLW